MYFDAGPCCRPYADSFFSLICRVLSFFLSFLAIIKLNVRQNGSVKVKLMRAGHDTLISYVKMQLFIWIFLTGITTHHLRNSRYEQTG